MKKINGFSFMESLVAFSITMMLVVTILPMISLLRQEEAILSDRRYITNRLHDEFQSVIWNTEPIPPPTTKTIRSIHVTFTFTKENEYIKGCGDWHNIRERDEKVCLYGVKKSEYGFTFLSSLLSILIIGMIFPLIANLYQVVRDMPSYTEEISIQQFFQFLRDDLAKAESFHAKGNRLNITLSDGTSTTIGQYNDLIRRQVDGKGHEIYLRDIKDVLFERLSYGIKTTIISSKGEKYVKHIASYP